MRSITGRWSEAPSAYLELSGQLVPLWAVRLLVFVLILPVAAAALDAVARTRRRGHTLTRWLAWVLTGAVPFVIGLAALLVARAAGLLSFTPPGAVGSEGVPRTSGDLAVMLVVLALVVVSFVFVRPLCLRLLGRQLPGGGRRPESPAADAAAVALSVVLCVLTLIVWVLNPFAALLLVPALHLWLWLAQPGARSRRWSIALLLLVGIAPGVLVLFYYGNAYGLSPLSLAWSLALMPGGAMSVVAALCWAVALGCAVERLHHRAARGTGRRDGCRGARDGAWPRELCRTRFAGRNQVGAAAMSTGLASSALQRGSRSSGTASTGRRLARILSTALIVVGLLLLADVATTLVWQEPVTAVIGLLKRADTDTRFLSYRTMPLTAAQRAGLERLSDAEARVAYLARQEQRTAPNGAAIGRLVIAKLGVVYDVVQGTSTGDLERGPGHYASTALPGEGRTIAIAGHRTTYLAPFRNLNELHHGDRIVLQMPYGRFTYVVMNQRIVTPNAWWITRNVGYERLVLSACNPLYSASQRIAVFARLLRVQPTAFAGVQSTKGWTVG